MKLNYLICFGILTFGFMLAGCGQVPKTVSSLSVTPSVATVGLNHTQTFNALVYYSDRSSGYVTASWSVSGGIGTITQAGVFTGTAEGTGKVSANYENYSATADITVTSKGSITGKVKSALDLTTAISNKRVYISGESSSYSATSGSDGSYTISDVPPGSYLVAVQESNDYLSTVESISVSTGESTSKTLYILPRVTINGGGIPIKTAYSLQVTGTVKNNGTKTAHGVKVNYTFYYYDPDFGSLPYAYSIGSIPSTITPESDASFSILIVDETLISKYTGSYTSGVAVTSLEASSL